MHSLTFHSADGNAPVFSRCSGQFRNVICGFASLVALALLEEQLDFLCEGGKVSYLEIRGHDTQQKLNVRIASHSSTAHCFGQLHDVNVCITMFFEVLNHFLNSWVVAENAHTLKLISEFPLLNRFVVGLLLKQVEYMDDVLDLLQYILEELEEALNKSRLQPHNFFVVVASRQ